MRVDVFCSQTHYQDHLAPIWFGLPAETRGTWWAAGRCADGGNTQGLPNWRRGHPLPSPDPVLVAGFADETAVRRPTIYLEHGAGQSYVSDDGMPVPGGEAYSGGPGHDKTILFLSPSEAVCAKWRVRYPHTPAVAVGVPKLDWWHDHPGVGGGPQPTLAITWHSDSRSAPETRTAFPFYRPRLAAAVGVLWAAGWQVLGHGHPRIWGTVAGFWEAIGVEAVENFDDVLRRADVLAADNTSCLPEFASTGRPIVFMDAPHYRRHVTHGGRFWSWPEGQISIQNADELPDAAVRALKREPAVETARQRMIDGVYVACDGHATERAVAAVLGINQTGWRRQVPSDG